MDKDNKTIQQPQPIGVGVFGDIYDQFKGRAKEAFDFLIEHQNGDLLGVFHREEFGDIDLVWGDDGGGFKHIFTKHIGENKSFLNTEIAVNEITSIITEGAMAFENVDKAVFQIGNRLVTIRKNFRKNGKKIADKNWVLTAYDEKAADGGSAITTSN